MQIDIYPSPTSSIAPLQLQLQRSATSPPLPIFELSRLNLSGSRSFQLGSGDWNSAAEPGTATNYIRSTTSEAITGSFTVNLAAMTSHGVTSPTPMVWDHTRSAPTTTTPSSSIQSRGIRNTTFLPISSILRPIFPVPLDQAKVASMLDTLARSNSSPQSASCGLNGDPLPDKLPPIDVLSYKSKKTGREFYFAFGGCHRLSAYERAEKEMVECKVLRVTRGMLGGYLGSSLGAILGEDE